MMRIVREYKGMAERALFYEDWVREVVPGDASVCALCSGNENICMWLLLLLIVVGIGGGKSVGAFMSLIEEV